MTKRRTVTFLAAALVAVIGVFVANLWAAKRRAESLNCASNVTSICLAARLWAEDHAGLMPTNFICMSDELATPKVLSCLAERRARMSNWSEYSPTNCTYEIVAPGMPAADTNKVFLRCTIHGHRGYSDSTVFDGVSRHAKCK